MKIIQNKLILNRLFNQYLEIKVRLRTNLENDNVDFLSKYGFV